jgi:hypothetical protein
MHFVICGVHTKPIPGGLNIQSAMRIFEATSSEEAIGKYILAVSEEFPEHELFKTPLFMALGGSSDQAPKAKE